MRGVLGLATSFINNSDSSVLSLRSLYWTALVRQCRIYLEWLPDYHYRRCELSVCTLILLNKGDKL